MRRGRLATAYGNEEEDDTEDETTEETAGETSGETSVETAGELKRTVIVLAYLHILNSLSELR